MTSTGTVSRFLAPDPSDLHRLIDDRAAHVGGGVLAHRDLRHDRFAARSRQIELLQNRAFERRGLGRCTGSQCNQQSRATCVCRNSRHEHSFVKATTSP